MNFRVFQKKKTTKKRISHYYLKKCLLILVTLKFRLAIVQKDRPHEITLSSISKPETAQDKQIQQSFNLSGLLSFVLSCTFQTIDLAKTLFSQWQICNGVFKGEGGNQILRWKSFKFFLVRQTHRHKQLTQSNSKLVSCLLCIQE